MLVWLSPFVYSKEQSKSNTLGFSTLRDICGCKMSLFSMTPRRTFESVISPPGTCGRAGKPGAVDVRMRNTYLLNLGVSLDVNFLLAIAIHGHSLDGIKSNAACQVVPDRIMSSETMP